MINPHQASTNTILFALTLDSSDAKDFLTYWNEGEFDVCKDLFKMPSNCVPVQANHNNETQGFRHDNLRDNLGQAIKDALETWYDKKTGMIRIDVYNSYDIDVIIDPAMKILEQHGIDPNMATPAPKKGIAKTISGLAKSGQLSPLSARALSNATKAVKEFDDESKEPKTP